MGIASSATSMLDANQQFQYIWIDKGINNKENQHYFNKFRGQGPVEKFSNIEDMNKFLDSLGPQTLETLKVIVVAAASLPQEAYESMQANDKIDKIVLFCSYYEKGKELREKYPKIQGLGLQDDAVITTLRYWKQYKKASVIFPVSIETLLSKQNQLDIDISKLDMKLFD